MYFPSASPAGPTLSELQKPIEEMPAEMVSKHILQELRSQNELLKSIKGMLTFFVVLTVISIFGAACILLQ